MRCVRHPVAWPLILFSICLATLFGFVVAGCGAAEPVADTPDLAVIDVAATDDGLGEDGDSILDSPTMDSTAATDVLIDASPAIGVTITPRSKLVTSEGGTTASFALMLDQPPTADVTIPISSSIPTEATVSSTSITFTKDNWNTPQTIIVTGVDDAIKDGDKEYKVLLDPAKSADIRYSGFDPADLDGINTDNEPRGISVKPLTGLITGEDGRSATFTIVLDDAPTDDVVIALSSSAPTEGTVSPTKIRFTPLNWEAPQVITVTGVDDSVEDRDKAYKVLTAKAESKDPKFNGLDPEDVAVTNVDNETPGFTLVTSSGKALVTNENGLSDTFTVALNAVPTGEVFVDVSSVDEKEVTVSPRVLKFTPLSWRSPQTVTVTGVDDLAVDGNKTVKVVLKTSTLTRATGYVGLDPDDITVTNLDDETPGITVNPTGLFTGEDGRSASFTIVLNAAPADEVKIPLSVAKAEGSIDRSYVIFTTLNWSSPQTVTVTGLDDSLADGNQVYRVITAPAESRDLKYAGLNAEDVNIVNIDDESPGVLIALPTAGLLVSESGTTDSFSAKLTAMPVAPVKIHFVSANPTECTILPEVITFTNVNWDSPQPLLVTGVDDSIADGNQPCTIKASIDSTSDAPYLLITILDIPATNNDDDSASVTLGDTEARTVTEDGTSATFTIKLDSKPTANVTCSFVSSNPAEGTVSPSSVTFTETNYNGAQVVTVTGVDDLVVDGNKSFKITTTCVGDVAYSAVTVPSVNVTNLDNDSAGVTITPSTPLKTTEASGAADFSIKLRSKPTATITCKFTSTKPGEGFVSPASVVFTEANWNGLQVVTVTGIDDFIADGNVNYAVKIVCAGDPDYSTVAIPNIPVVNIDNDSPGVTLAPTTALTTTESGGAATFTIKLNSQPLFDVTCSAVSLNLAEGTVAPATTVFTSVSWRSPATITVTGKNDLPPVADGNILYFVRVTCSSEDPAYSGLAIPNISVTNNDNDTANITVLPATGLVTTEAGGIATFTVNTTTLPAAPVTITLTSSRPMEGVVAASVVIDPASWTATGGVVVTVTGVNDDIADGDVSYTIVTSAATSPDPKYAGINPPDVALVNKDNDTAGLVVSPLLGSTTEAGGTASFVVRLNSKPIGAAGVIVTCPVTSTAVTEGKITSPATAALTFNDTSWAINQTVIVTGQNDFVADGNIPYSVRVGPCTSVDVGYAGKLIDLALTNTDNDTAGVTVTPTAGLVTTEARGTATFTMLLNSQPLANVTCGLLSSNPAEGTVAPASVVFTSANWNLPQTVTISGVDDAVVDGDKAYSIITATCVSTDLKYNVVNPADVAVTNRDNDLVTTTVGFPSTASSTNKGTLTPALAFWLAGEYVTQTFPRTASVTSLTVSFNMYNTTNTSCGATALSWRVLLNGVNVGTFGWTIGSTGNPAVVSRAYSFPAVSAVSGSFVIRYEAVTPICTGGGSWGWWTSGSATLR